MFSSRKSPTATANDGTEPELQRYDPRCRACGKPVGVDDAYCPHCGHWDYARSGPEPTNPWDYVGAIVMAITAVAVTIPTLVGLMDSVRGHRHSDAMILATWHCYVWGVPAALVVYRWRRNVLAHRPAMENLAKAYFLTQFVVLFLLPCLILSALLTLKNVFLS